MDLAFVEDFTSNEQLDADLLSIAPTSGLYLNSGTHPLITIENLLQFLPRVEFSLGAWASGITYGDYSVTRSRGDLVTDGQYIYESIQDANTGNALTDTAFWRRTNQASILLRNHIQRVKDRVYSDLHLTRRLVDNQYLYEVGRNVVTLPADYAAWVFEPKGSDYVRIRVNEMCLQAMTTNPVTVTVVNQGQVRGTLTLTPNNGELTFQQAPFTMTGKGPFYFVIDSQQVKVSGNHIDPLKFNGFTAYTAIGIGGSPQTATWSISTAGNGMGFNVSAYTDTQSYIDYHVNEFAGFVRSTFEKVTFEMFISNSNSRSNREQRNILDPAVLKFEAYDTTGSTVARRYEDERKRAFRQLERTFDRELRDMDSSDFEVEISSL